MKFVLPACRRLHRALQAPAERDRPGLQQLAEQQHTSRAQVAHEAETATLALAVLVRLTAHAGGWQPLRRSCIGGQVTCSEALCLGWRSMVVNCGR